MKDSICNLEDMFIAITTPSLIGFDGRNSYYEILQIQRSGYGW